MAYQNPYNPDALPQFPQPEPKGGGSDHHRQPSPAQVYQQSPPPQQQNFRPQQQPQYHQHQHQQYYEQQPPRRQPEPQYRVSDHRPLSPAVPPRDSHNSGGGGGGGGGRIGLPSGPRNGANTAPPPRSPLPPRSPVYAQTSSGQQSPHGGVVFQVNEELSTEQLRVLFEGLDTNRVGYVTEKQLADNLINSDRTKFNAYTVNMMVRMFDSNHSGNLDFEEFKGLWRFLDSWRSLFHRFDADRSGTISKDEYKTALAAFQYRLSDDFIDSLFDTYDREHKGVITFDLFMQSCVTLKQMTDVFKKFDEDRDGFITISFERFLSVILSQIKKVMLVEDRKN